MSTLPEVAVGVKPGRPSGNTFAYAPTRQPTPPRKPRPPRQLTFALPLAVGETPSEPGILDITEVKGRKTLVSRYLLSRIGCDWGEAFHLEKIGVFGDDEAEDYQVYFEDDQNHQCNCRGFLRWDHCKHVDALRHLRASGQL